uniref:Uncharacterized protein n=1 Tax=Anguilla anguilla TaxID=7936 RepID=A0A0E9VNE5_ANGAN
MPDLMPLYGERGAANHLGLALGFWLVRISE